MNANQSSKIVSALSCLTATWFSFAASSNGYSLPCLDRPLPLTDPTIGVTVFPDCESDSQVYFVPQKLVLKEASFSGERSFLWRDLSDGGARVTMAMNLLVDEGKMLRALIDLKQRYQKRFTVLPFTIRNVNFSGFDPIDGVTDQRFNARSDFSTGTFGLRLSLSQEGVELWRESSLDGFWFLSSANLGYELRGMFSGSEQWRSQSHSVEVETLPACSILGEACEDSLTKRLEKKGRMFGRFHFHQQYLNCQDFISGSLQAPGRAMFSDLTLTEGELDIVYLLAKDSYEQEQSIYQQGCQNEIDFAAGQKWFSDYRLSNSVRCDSINSHPIAKLLSNNGERSNSWKDGLRSSYQSYVDECGVTEQFICDELAGDDWCPATRESSRRVCYDLTIFENLNMESGQCTFVVFKDTFIAGPGSWSRIARKYVSVETSKLVDTCVDLSKTIGGVEEIRSRIICE